MQTGERAAYQRAIDELWARSNYERGHISNPFGDVAQAERGMRRTRELLDALGNPERACPVIHVAGSKGKGSTSAMIASALSAAGHRTGLYTSPHLHAFRERIAVGGEAVSEETFASLCEEATAAAEQVERAHPDLGTVTTFELVTGMGFLAFAHLGCDAAVVEVGLGGLWDATNVVDPLVSVVTRIDLEHTAVLGTTLPEIAAQKAGIIKPGRPVVVGPQRESCLPVFRERAMLVGSPLLLGGVDWQTDGAWQDFRVTGPWGTLDHLSLALPGAFQVENAGTAVAALWVADREGLAVPQGAVRTGLAAVRWPGRFERVTIGGREVVLDGAHTPAAAAALAESIAAERPGEPSVAVVGISKDKDPDLILAALAPVVTSVVATRSGNPRAAEATAVAAAADRLGLPCTVVEPVADAVRSALAGAAPVLVTGSLFTVAEAREALGLARPDPPPTPQPPPSDVG